jgi:uncharacterized OsmC-like protein
MPTLEPTIVVSSENAGSWGRRVSIDWPDEGWRVHGDNSVSHGGTGTAPDGFGLMGAAFGVCMVTTLIDHARQLGFRLDRVEALVAVKARLQGRDKAPYLTDFRIDVYVEGELDEAARAELERATAATCGVRETLQRVSAVSERVHLGRAPSIG